MSTHVVLEHGEDREVPVWPKKPKGTWWYEGGDEYRLIVCSCPGCGIDSTMSKSVHTVADDGTVTPSYVCPHRPCSFHEMVRLGGWTVPDRRTR